MQKLKEEGIDLVITVDCGATATAALTAAREAGLDVIVLDHPPRSKGMPPAIRASQSEPARYKSGLESCYARQA